MVAAKGGTDPNLFAAFPCSKEVDDIKYGLPCQLTVGCFWYLPTDAPKCQQLRN